MRYSRPRPVAMKAPEDFLGMKMLLKIEEMMPPFIHQESPLEIQESPLEIQESPLEIHQCFFEGFIKWAVKRAVSLIEEESQADHTEPKIS